VIDAAREILRTFGCKSKIELHAEMPTGPLNRVADNSLAKELLRWEPRVMFTDGVHRTIDWYVTTKKKDEVSLKLEAILTER
jgi:nucleoside-diphosphate-sugar epimerase